ncbi:hypothetical protein SLS62_011182 [Diatrype stigma]|uniref:Uncharacterized protein n=1 Tax=Diatrype stigma TaxID=117547 RepID=A0AAN9U4I6_9PEZI
MAPAAAAERDGDHFTYCVGSPTWHPARYAADHAAQARAAARLEKDDLYGAIAESFHLRPLPPPQQRSARTGKTGDTFVYHAIISLTLAQAQQAVALGDGGPGEYLHAWYRDPEPAPSSGDEEPQPIPHRNPPGRPDIDAYLSIFDPTTATPAALRSFAANAKKDSVRRRVADYLLSKRFLHPALLPGLEIPKVKVKAKKPKPNNPTSPSSTTTTNNDNNNNTDPQQQTAPSPPSYPPANPYLQFAAWASRNLEWAGPCDLSEEAPGAGHRGHPILPILMHHFGCACPSHEALEILRVLAGGRPIVDAGSGNGYWTFMLRAYEAAAAAARSGGGGDVAIIPVDSKQSVWRTMWVRDTVEADAAEWLAKTSSSRGEDKNKDAGDEEGIDDDRVLLVVYPIVGGGVAGGEEGGFTRGLLRAYRGDTLAVVGTQNRNGYTGFLGRSMDEYMAAEEPAWTKVAQVPLPSFPGKDDAMFVFQRGRRAEALRRREGSGDGGE